MACIENPPNVETRRFLPGFLIAPNTIYLLFAIQFIYCLLRQISNNSHCDFHK